MKLQLWSIGKDHEAYVKPGVDDFTKRISRYYPVEWMIIAPPRNAGALSPADMKKKEGDMLLESIGKDDHLVALDERGRQLTSEGLAQFIQARANESIRNLIFVHGDRKRLYSYIIFFVIGYTVLICIALTNKDDDNDKRVSIKSVVSLNI